MKRKKWTILVVALALILPSSIMVYGITGNFGMRYLPGTNDFVTNMPDDDSGIGGQPYAVSRTVPQREGYEFLGWTLDYGLAATYTLTYHVAGDPNNKNTIPGDSATPDPVDDIVEGSSITLADKPVTSWKSLDGTDPATAKETYMVNYLEVGTDRVLAPQKVVTDQTIGTTVTEEAIDIDGYVLVGADAQDLTIKQSKTGKWTFTGWCSDEACTNPITEVTNITANTDVYGKWRYETIKLADNEITFYYKKQPEVQKVSYTVQYIDVETGESLCDDITKTVDKESLVTEIPLEFEDYESLDGEHTFIAKGGEIITFIYYYYWHVE